MWLLPSPMSQKRPHGVWHTVGANRTLGSESQSAHEFQLPDLGCEPLLPQAPSSSV